MLSRKYYNMTGFRQFQVVSGGLKWFQIVPRFSK